jgi:hypothetical protein
MQAPRSLSARLRAAAGWVVPVSKSLGTCCALLTLLSVVPTARAQAPTATQRNAASRLRSQPEVVAAPPAASAAPPATPGGQPTYEFESGPPISEGEIFDSGEFSGEMMGGEHYDESMDYRPLDSGYGRYGCSDGCRHPFHCHQLYFRADYLLWWGKGFTAPPLVTTSTAGTSVDDAGVLGLSGTAILFPGDAIADTSQSGGRVRLGYWFDPCDTMAVEATYFAIGQATTSFSASDFDYAILARPFVNLTPNVLANDAALVAYPNLYSGSINASGNSSLQGIEVVARHIISRGCDWRLDWTLGWRYNRLDESLSISTDRVTLGSPTAPTTGATLAGWDRFSTNNYFNGVQLGMISEVRKQRWWFETRATLALGNNRAIVNIDGQSTAVTPVQGGQSQTVVSPGGLLTQPTNIGEYYNDDFAVVPQIGANLGFELTSGLWLTVGYNFMYWSRTARPGEQIDTDLNLSQAGGGELVGLARPSFTGLTTDYWAQGLNFGLAYRY